jgi:hypothetical protein
MLEVARLRPSPLPANAADTSSAKIANRGDCHEELSHPDPSIAVPVGPIVGVRSRDLPEVNRRLVTTN